MATISARHRGAWGADTSGSEVALDRPRTGLRRALYVVGGLLGALFAAELVLPEADPDRVRPLLVDLGYLDRTAPLTEHRAALESFQRSAALPAHGEADGPTVSALVKAARELWELRDLGLVPAPS